VVGFDNIPEAAYINSGLTTVDQFIDKMGHVATEMLIDLMQGNSLDSSLYEMPTQLIAHDLATAYYVSDRIAIMFRGHIVEMGSVEKVLMEPKHPYTKLLRESIPETDPKKRWSERVTLSDIEHEEYLREGCKFAGRCPGVMEICKGVVPEDVWVDGVLVKCHKYTGY
jgi:oligopeptide/dipeptide ABC transporter ATP-binding protein